MNLNKLAYNTENSGDFLATESSMDGVSVCVNERVGIDAMYCDLTRTTRYFLDDDDLGYHTLISLLAANPEVAQKCFNAYGDGDHPSFVVTNESTC